MNNLKKKIKKELNLYEEYRTDNKYYQKDDRKLFIENILKIVSEHTKQLEDENQKLKVNYCQLEAVLKSRNKEIELLQKQLNEDNLFINNLYGKITDLSEVLGMIAVIKELIDKEYYVALENYIYDEHSNIEEKLKNIISELHLLMVHKKK